MKPLKAAQIREAFLSYFEKNGHRRVPSSAVVPHGDSTILFTNAGMNQFKGVFTGQETRDYKRAVSSQKCMRAGGKHNDLENVGYTARHHTFFEMLGNFSFGDYFKKDAIRFAWEFVTQELALPTDKLYVTVFLEDDEAFGIWNKEIGLHESRISRFGVKDNFWSMGDTGPCGPCSEIFFDRGAENGCGKADCKVGCDCDRFMEFWNLVFMEFEQKADGTREKLPKPSIDTGMGLERIAAILQGAKTNYDIDSFSSILAEISRGADKPYAEAPDSVKTAMRVVADHARSTTFLIADGVLPSKDGRGYVLRRIMRRAMVYARKIQPNQVLLSKVCDAVIREMSGAYPELTLNREKILFAVQDEEKKFSETVSQGQQYLLHEVEKVKSKKLTLFPGASAYHLYETYGFPVDLTQVILREHGMTLDEAGFDEANLAHREKARGSWKGSQTSALDHLVNDWTKAGLKTEFLGYETLAADGKVLRLVAGGKEVGAARAGEEVELVADRTPFYGESGGQVGDIGGISGEGFVLEVVDTKKPAGIHVHKCIVVEGEVKAGAAAQFTVNDKARHATAKNHTATHLLHATLIETLGQGVSQKGSLVSPERLRFDFTHAAPLTAAEIAHIEQVINERIWADTNLEKETMPLDQAIAKGAMALFDEKYGAQVRVVSVGEYSKELCGGTHLTRTGEIGIFKVVKEGGVAAGIRRLEAFTGYRALRYAQELDARMRELGTLLGVAPEGAIDRVGKLLGDLKDLRKKGTSKASTGEAKVEEVGGAPFAVLELEGADAKELREIADRQMEKISRGVVVVANAADGKVSLIVKVSKDLTGKVAAGELVKEAAKILGGSGGGRPDMAQAGGANVAAIGDAIAKIKSLVAA